MKKIVAYLNKAYETGKIQHFYSFIIFISLIFYFTKSIIFTHESLKRFSPDTTIYVATVIIVGSLVFIKLAKMTTSLNYTKYIEIENAIEYLTVMERLNILDYNQQIEFVKQNCLDVYISKGSIYSGTIEKIRAKLYAQFIHRFSDHYEIYKLIATRRLCFDKENIKIHITDKEIADSLFSSEDENLKVITELTNERNALQLKTDEYLEANKTLKLELRSEKATCAKLKNKSTAILFESKILLRIMASIFKGTCPEKKLTHSDVNALYKDTITNNNELKEQVKQMTNGDPSKIEKKFTPSTDMHAVLWGELACHGLVIESGNPNQLIKDWPTS